MNQEYWVRQPAGKHAYPDIVWSRPETKQASGKLLIIGGNSFGFAAVGEAYAAAQTAGAGSIRVLLPSAIKKVVGSVLEHAEYGTSNPSGSFSQMALSEWLDNAAWADATIIAGDLGRNSETAILVEKFLAKYTGAVTITKDAVDYFVPLAKTYAHRPNTTLVLSVAQLQKLGTGIGFEHAFRLGMDLTQLVDVLHIFTKKYGIEIVVKHHDTICVAINGQVSTTNTGQSAEDIWRVKTAANAAVWRLQNTGKAFEAITCAVA